MAQSDVGECDAANCGASRCVRVFGVRFAMDTRVRIDHRDRVRAKRQGQASIHYMGVLARARREWCAESMLYCVKCVDARATVTSARLNFG